MMGCLSILRNDFYSKERIFVADYRYGLLLHIGNDVSYVDGADVMARSGRAYGRKGCAYGIV